MVAEMKQNGAELDRKEIPPGTHNPRNREKSQWKNQSHPPDWLQEGLLCSFCATGESKLCVLTRVGPCRAFDVLGSAAQLRAPPQLCFPHSFPNSFPCKASALPHKEFMDGFLCPLYIHNLALNAFRPCLGKCCFKYWNETTIFILSSSKDIQVHDITGFSHWFFKKKVKALSVHSQAEVSQEGYSQDNCGRRSRAGLSSVLLRKK